MFEAYKEYVAKIMPAIDMLIPRSKRIIDVRRNIDLRGNRFEFTLTIIGEFLEKKDESE